MSVWLCTRLCGCPRSQKHSSPKAGIIGSCVLTSRGPNSSFQEQYLILIAGSSSSPHLTFMGSVQFQSVAEDLSLSTELIINSKYDVMSYFPLTLLKCWGHMCLSKHVKVRATLWSGSPSSSFTQDLVIELGLPGLCGSGKQLYLLSSPLGPLQLRTAYAGEQ